MEVVGGLQNEMEKELKQHGDLGLNDCVTDEEKNFLDLVEHVTWSEEEINKLNEPTSEQEILRILKNETNLDSAPGEDGLTARFMLILWEFESYRWLYVKFLNYTRFSSTFRNRNNIGIMVIKNKKSQSIEYDKKRKLTKINKDSNIGNGKVWTNRMREIVLPKILPINQFNCQKTVNIIDEIREIRDVNLDLLKEGKDGTILSIDFNNAFRSISLRWFNLVMKKFQVPASFLNWFWRMYENLGIIIVVNSCKSDILKVKRGFMEGHPASMAAFVTALIPLMIKIDNSIAGLKVHGQVHKCKLFADDLKVFLIHLNKVDLIEDFIGKFEHVSGVLLHRDSIREKCQALPFGKHKDYKDWNKWPWITVKGTIKVVNTELAVKNGFLELHKSFGYKWTI